MTNALPPWPLFSTFLIASLVLAVTPGPGVIYIVTRSLAQGRRIGLASVLGVALGNLCNAIGASIGLAALFAISSFAFSIFKYAGATYLVYLGIRALRATKADGAVTALNPATLSRVFRDGFLVALFHPKTTLFFAAFLPQFLTQGAPPMLQSVLLGSIFVAIALVTDALYAMTASTMARLFARSNATSELTRFFSGGVFIGLGVLTALASRSAK